MQNPQAHNGLFPAEQLIYIEDTKIKFNERVLESLKTHFDPQKKISVQVAAGKCGTGKSSHQNAIAKYLFGDLTNKETPFAVKRTSKTFTQGVWIYPYPLSASEHPDVQILLVDLEGMDPLKSGDQDVVKLALMKIYSFGMLISSAFTIHTESKPSGTDLEILKKAAGIYRDLSSKYDVQPPKLFMLVKDADEIDSELIDSIKENLEGYEEELEELIIKGKSEPPTTFKKSCSEDCSELEKEASYLTVIRALVEVIATNPKADPILVNHSININSLCVFIKKICAIFNKEDFESKVPLEIDQMKYEKMTEIYHKHINKSIYYLKDKAKKEDLSISRAQFEDKIETFIEKLLQAFINDINESVKLSRTIETWITRHKEKFVVTAKAIDVLQIFLCRKQAADEDEKRAKDSQAQKDQIKQIEQIAAIIIPAVLSALMIKLKIK